MSLSLLCTKQTIGRVSQLNVSLRLTRECREKIQLMASEEFSRGGGGPGSAIIVQIKEDADPLSFASRITLGNIQRNRKNCRTTSARRGDGTRIIRNRNCARFRETLRA